ncbi:hypothetical protein [Stenotrophomonas rhizophila]|nr:hypothetical protein [Stenotrophomonas rhizophila]
MFKIVDVEALVSQAKASGASRIEVDVTLLATYSEEACITQTQWMGSPHCNKNYAWLHVDAEGIPFYAGYGRGARAWQKNGGYAWEWFVREQLGGDYRVAILAVGMTDAHAQAIFEQMLEMYNTKLLNQSSFHRGMDYAALEEERAKKEAIRPFYRMVRHKKPARQIFETAQQALAMQYALDPHRTETGRFGEVLKAMDAYTPLSPSFIAYIVEWYVGRGDIPAAKAALEGFTSRAPRQARHEKIVHLAEIVERGSFATRPKWLDPPNEKDVQQ